MGKLTQKDYEDILNFYSEKVPLGKNTRKISAEKVLASKMCKCIKQVKTKEDQDEQRSIAICKKGIFENRGLQFSKFKCKGPKGPHFIPIKNKRGNQTLMKTLKRIRFRKGLKTLKKRNK